jgi:predicted dehydrogenase
VGVGLWGRTWAEHVASAPGYRLVGIADAGAPAREWAEQALGVPTFRDLARALRATEPDVVVLASPPSTHRPLAELALAEGCHVIVEKPLAPALSDAVAIADASARTGRIAMASQNYRFRRQPRALRELVAGGALGPLHGIRISCRRDLRDAWISRRDWRGRMPHPYLLDMAIHHVDLIRMITGREVTEVDARGWIVPDSPFKHEPTVAALLTLDDGTPVAYEGTWAEPFSETSWNGDWEVLGARGRATWSGGVDDALRGTVRLGRHRQRAARVSLPALRFVDRPGVLAELRRAIASGEQPECSAADNVSSLAAILAIARSTDERRPVRVEELLAG